MGFVFLPILDFVHVLLRLYTWVLLGSVILSWLILFQVVNPYQPLVRKVMAFCAQLTEPPLAYIRRFVPFVGGMDFSPLLLFFAIYFVQTFVERTMLTLL